MEPHSWDTFMLLGQRAYEARDFEQAREAFLGAVQAVSQEGDTRLASSLNNLAAVFRLQGDVPQAIRLQEQSLAVLRRLLGDKHPQTALGMANLGEMYLTAERHTEAVTAFLVAVDMSRSGEDPQLYRQCLERLGSFYLESQKVPEAALVYADLRASLAGDSPESAAENGSREDLARVCHMLANLYDSQGQSVAAEEARQQALTLLEAEWGADSPQLADILINMAESLSANGQMAEAAGYVARARGLLGQFRTTGGAEAATQEIIYLREAGLLDEAERLAHEALGDAEVQGSLRARLQNELGLAIFLQQRFAEAERSFRESLESWTVDTEASVSSRAATLFNLASALLGQQRWEEAGQQLAVARSLAEEHLGREHPLLQRILLNTIEVHLRLGQSAEAERVREHLEELSRGLGP